MGKDFNKDLDDLFDRDELLTEEVEVVSDADCDLFCDGDLMLHLIADTPSTIRVGRGKHILVFMAEGGKKKSRTIEVGNSRISISVSGLQEGPSTDTVPPVSPDPPTPPIQDETVSEGPRKGRPLYWILGSLCGVILLLILIANVNDNIPILMTSCSSTPKLEEVEKKTKDKVEELLTKDNNDELSFRLNKYYVVKKVDGLTYNGIIETTAFYNHLEWDDLTFNVVQKRDSLNLCRDVIVKFHDKDYNSCTIIISEEK